MRHATFYLQYALRTFIRNRRWTTFAVLSVVAGVATVVALRSLGLAIGESLTTNVRSVNKGDITLERASGPGGFSFGTDAVEGYFTDFDLRLIRNWVAENDGVAAEYSASNLQITRPGGTSGLRFATAILIDPATYPPVGEIRTIQPADTPAQSLIQTQIDIVISDNLADAQNIAVGDEVQVTGSTTLFTVRGIVPTEIEAGLRDPFAALFGFAYFRSDAATLLNLDLRPNRISIALPDGTTDQAIRDAGDELNAILSAAGVPPRIITVPALVDQNAFIADAIGRFIVVMGLGAMLIGGVGIINTMLVMVRRRTEEIAALKTFGLKGRQVAALFMTEALLYGVTGSLIGSILGSFLSRLTNAYGEQFIQQSLPWRIYPEAILFGIVLGVVVTLVFSVVPVLTAVKVRPNNILRPNDTVIPVLGIAQSLGVTGFVVLALGLIAGQIIGPFPAGIRTFAFIPIPQQFTAGILMVAFTLTILGLLVAFLWAIVWLIARLPAFGWIELSLALKNLGTRRLRTATTLLAISTGIFAISAISFYGSGIREILQVRLADSFGGNILIISPSSFALDVQAAENAQQVLDDKLDELGDQIIYRSRLQSFDGRIEAVDDLSLRNLERGIDREALFDEINEAARAGDFERVSEISTQIGSLQTPLTLATWKSDNPDLDTGQVTVGRQITPDDEGANVAVVLFEDRMRDWGVALGSTITISVQGREHNFEVIGLISDGDGLGQDAPAEILVPFGTLGNTLPNFQLNSVMVDPDDITSVENAISTLPFYFPVNVRLIDGILSRVIDQFSALPLLVALLSLGAAAVIMANTVALATFERRRQIGILKAVGLKRRRVLTIITLENTVISVLAAFVGIGASGVMTGLLTTLGLNEFVFLPDDSRPVTVALVVAALSIGIIATLASASGAVRERVLNVLRYE